MTDELLHRVALTHVPDIGPVQAKTLVEHFGSAANVFAAKKKELASIERMSEAKARNIKAFDDFDAAEAEILFCHKEEIEILFLTDERYPRRLLHCYDAPTLLYYRGNANLNHNRIISIIGTRTNTGYGKQVTEQIVADLGTTNATIVSGLAFGIDAAAHKAALQQQLPTIAVLAHGLHTIYPSQHTGIAKQLTQHGALLTEFGSTIKADKHNFPRRNRIVAGIADATIVIETGTSGGSMITAELAYTYNRDVYAVPGRINDSKSSGCLQLIQQNKAAVFTSVPQMLQDMGWETATKKKATAQQQLFVELNNDEQKIVGMLQQKDTLHIDELYQHSGLSNSAVAAAILNLELNNLLIALPGKAYRLA